ncbi:MAG: hypothetical protein WCK21_07125, partial [Actinomycetota bacterium]
MGLFSKKPKPDTAASSAAASTAAKPPKANKPDKAQPRAKPERVERQRLPKKVDPADFFAVRAELGDVRARLEASEQAKAIVEARLAALDATTTAIASNRLGGEDLRTRVNELEGQLHGVS